MKKHLLILICLLITVSIPAQEVSRNLELKSLRQGINTKPISSNHIYSVPEYLNEGTGYKIDSAITYRITSSTDSVLYYVGVNRYNSEGIWYLQNFKNHNWNLYSRYHFIYDEKGNVNRSGKLYDITSNVKKYTWDFREDSYFNDSGNRIRLRDYWDTETGWKKDIKTVWYYSEEITPPNILYDWYRFTWGYRHDFYEEPTGDTLLLIYLWDENKSDYVNLWKVDRKYDNMGYMSQNVRYDWSDTESRWIPVEKEELLHGPSGLDTLCRTFGWDENEKVWWPSWADTLRRDENGNWTDYKVALNFTYQNGPNIKLKLLLHYIAEYDTHGNQILLEKYEYDIDGIETQHYKEYKYWSLPETSKDASLYDVSFTPGELRPVIDGKVSKYSTLLDEGINDYYIFINDTATVVPPITLVKNDPNSSVEVKEATDLRSANKEDRTTTVTVTAEDGSTTRDYSFEFHVIDHLATLDTLIVSEGKLSPEFDPDVLIYYDTISGSCPGDTTPVVEFTTSSPYATTTKEDALLVCSFTYNKTEITVVADDGVKFKKYTIIFKVVPPTNIGEIHSNDFVIYPNPVVDILKLEHSNPMMEVTVFNMLGQKVGEYALNSVSNCEISLAGLNKGVYSIRMTDGNGQVYTRKVIKD